MAEARPKTIKASDTEAMEAAQQAAAAELPPAGHERDEFMRRRQDQLDMEIERVSEQIVQGTVDASKMEVINEIAAHTQYLSVSNPNPERAYTWVSRNRHSQHIQLMRSLGWQVIQGHDEEAVELKGAHGATGDSTRQLGDVILMWMPRDRYVVMRGMQLAQTKSHMQAAPLADLLDMAQAHRGNVEVKAYKMDSLTGPPVKPQQFTTRAHAMRYAALRKQAGEMFDQQLRDGNVQGVPVAV